MSIPTPHGDSIVPPLLDLPEIRRALAVLTRPGQVLELRILQAKMAASRYAYL